MIRRSLLAGLAALPASLAMVQRVRASGSLRLMTSPIDAGAEPYYAQDLGFFRAAGLDAEIIATSNGAVVLNSVVANSADIGFANLISIAVAFKRKIPITIVAPGSFYDSKTPTSLLLVSKSSPIKKAADLNGKTIAAAGLGTIAEYAPKIWMDRNGGDSSTVRFVELNMPQIADALNAGRVDAGLVTEPFLSEALPQTTILAPCYDAIAPRFTIAAFFASLEWAKANVDAVNHFRDVILRTAAWANTHHDQSGAILEKYGKLSPGVVRVMRRIGYESNYTAKSMQPLIDLAARYGGLDATFPAEQLLFKP